VIVLAVLYFYVTKKRRQHKKHVQNLKLEPPHNVSSAKELQTVGQQNNIVKHESDENNDVYNAGNDENLTKPDEEENDLENTKCQQ